MVLGGFHVVLMPIVHPMMLACFLVPCLFFHTRSVCMLYRNCVELFCIYGDLMEKFSPNAVNYVNPVNGVQSVDDNFPKLDKVDLEDEVKDIAEDFKPGALGSLLPDEDELFAGIMDDFDLSQLPSQLKDLEEDDIFGSGGGMELDIDPQESLSIGLSKLSIAGGASNGLGQYTYTNGVGTATVAGEHPYGEHPSRTLFVRNINSNVEDSELRSLFEVILL